MMLKKTDEKVIKLPTKKYNLALQEETLFNIGDNVRCIINHLRKSLPKWSKTIHKIISNTSHMYTLDNNKHYKYYELQKVDDVETSGRESNLPTREDIMKKNTINRKRKQEGIF